ncbi:MAG TPA: zf-HC2 domain-containing protein [Gammaproteobacteria bacterium]|nr:zf-HC2 domain-containing protein [Gammaproteobacteria bacterium]
MLKCNEVVQNASAYLDGELPMLSRWRIRLHLKICENCQRFVAQLRLTGSMLRLHQRDEHGDGSDPEVDSLVQKILAANRDRRP